MNRGARMSAATGAGRGKKGFHVESQSAPGPADSLVSDFSLQDCETVSFHCFQPSSAVLCYGSTQTLIQSGLKSKLYHVTSCVTLGDSLNLSELQSPGQKRREGTFLSREAMGVKRDAEWERGKWWDALDYLESLSPPGPASHTALVLGRGRGRRGKRGIKRLPPAAFDVHNCIRGAGGH